MVTSSREALNSFVRESHGLTDSEKKEEDDLLPKTRENYSLEDLKKMWMSKSEHPTVYISASKKINTDELKEVMYQHIKETHMDIYPHQLLY